MQNNQKQLIEAARSGSVSAFEQLIAQTQKKMLGLAAGLASCPFEAEDIYQDAMISAFKAMPKFRMESQFSTWLYRILVNTAISSRRKLKNRLSQLMSSRDDSQLEEESEYAGEQYSIGKNPERQLVNSQLSHAINQALVSLSEQERIAFVLCHQQEFKIIDAAQVMNCSEGTVKSYLFRSREKMREQLQAFME